MHELSVVLGIVQAVEESLSGRHISCVYTIRLKVGALSGVVEEALRFSYDVASKGTILDGSRLDVNHIPAVIYCDICSREVELPGVQDFSCPVCGTPSFHLRQGRELEIESLEIEEEEPTGDDANC
ncbi:MAG TPA: hydrogenase maturation nickel metallochaperone HypA [Candidatus Limnocylindrales bacterium]|jgi:hydrogenase nickel incorporation protein HypA/HybF|nr:hydrogenase maturation nickel metallochaperone HypA [Candidatus Limnocylindrales bacterium]